MIRPATPSDIDFLVSVARARYAEQFDEAAVRKFLAHSIADPASVVLRTERGGALATITRQVWGGPPRAYLLFIASLPGRGMIGDGVRLVRAVDTWRRARGAVALHFGEETGADFAPLARRVGAQIDRPSYVIYGEVSPVAAASPVSAVPGSSLLERVLTSPNLVGGAPAMRIV